MISLARRANIFLLFMTGAAEWDFKIQVIVQSGISLSPLIWGLDDDSFSGKMHTGPQSEACSDLSRPFGSNYQINLKKEKQNSGLKALCVRTSFLTHANRASCVSPLRHLMCFSKWMSALAHSLLRYLTKYFVKYGNCCLFPPTEDIVVALYCVYVQRSFL